MEEIQHFARFGHQHFFPSRLLGLCNFNYNMSQGQQYMAWVGNWQSE